MCSTVGFTACGAFRAQHADRAAEAASARMEAVNQTAAANVSLKRGASPPSLLAGEGMPWPYADGTDAGARAMPRTFVTGMVDRRIRMRRVRANLLLLMLLSLLLFRASAVAAAAQSNVADDRFDGRAIDRARWQTFSNFGASVAESGGALAEKLPAGVTSEAGVKSYWKLRGPFDVQVDYALPQWPVQGHTWAGLAGDLPGDSCYVKRMSDPSYSEGGQFYLTHFLAGQHNPETGLATTSDRAGSFRLVRDASSTMTAYYRSVGSADWVVVSSALVPAEDMGMVLACAATGPEGTTVVFDSFRVNSGEVIAMAAPVTAPPLTVGVLPFTAKDDKLASQVSDIIAADLSRNNQIRLVERARLGEVLAELGLGASGVGDPETAQKVGFLAGARVLVWGQLGAMNQQLIAIGSVVGVETGRAFVEQVRGPRDGDLVALIDQLAARLAARILSEREALVASEDQESLQASLNALAEKLKGSSLPKVAVVVEGEVASSPLASALESEFMLWLVRCGFPVVETDERAATGVGVTPSALSEEATVLLVAEASVTPGDSYGPLQTARYRLRVRAVNRRTGEVIAVAQRAGEYADLTPESASVHGLQRAATSIAAELLPKLADVPAER